MSADAPSEGYWISGVKVQFPGKPYPSQFSMMANIINGLEKKQNCLLESPTGSGKSLALLCSSLAWLYQQYDKKSLEEEESLMKSAQLDSPGDRPESDAADFPCQCKQRSNNACPAIADVKQVFSQDDDFQPAKRLRIYNNDLEVNSASITRCHVDKTTPMSGCSCDPQMEQPQVSENPKIYVEKTRIPKIFFGTRTHKQITQIIRELKKTRYKDVSMTILSSRERTCVHPEVSKSKRKNEDCSELIDSQSCLFYLTRRMNMEYFQDLPGFTEAWDIEDLVKFGHRKKICPYFQTRHLMERADIVFCPYNYLIDPSIRSSLEINLAGDIVIIDEAHNIEDSARSHASFEVTSERLKSILDDFESLSKYKHGSFVHKYFIEKISALNQLLHRNENNLDEYNTFTQQGKSWMGHEFVAMLINIGLGPEDFGNFQEQMKKLNDEIESSRQPENRVVTITSGTMAVLRNLQLSFRFLFKENMRYVDDYRVAILRTLAKTPEPDSQGWRNSRRSQTWTMSLNLWCLNPAVAFSELQNVHSLILASGTLSPMASFQSELATPFPRQLEANHVIEDSQVWVGTISHGPRGTLLNGTFKNSETFVFQDEIGELILHVCNVIPHGVLCFLPSYGMMEKLINRWQSTGLWERLQVTKHVFKEPKAARPEFFDEIMHDFYDIISESTEKDGIDGEQNGALFFAVCRGKVSEGLDFADNNARAVITVGIPFPSIKDVQIQLKKDYNNKHFKQRNLMNGNEWYETQAFRALNQALGRCIRHKNDWGAIILVDDRFSQSNRHMKNFSKWVRRKIRHFNNFGVVQKSLKAFADLHQQKERENRDTSLMSVDQDQSTLTNIDCEESNTSRCHSPDLFDDFP